MVKPIEDEIDLGATRAAQADPENAEPIAWEAVKSELGL